MTRRNEGDLSKVMYFYHNSMRKIRNGMRNYELLIKGFKISSDTCKGCGISTFNYEYYMVHSHIWNKANRLNRRGMLCIGCLERRLGRMLTASDFTDCPLNKKPKWHKCSERLLSRRAS